MLGTALARGHDPRAEEVLRLGLTRSAEAGQPSYVVPAYHALSTLVFDRAEQARQQGRQAQAEQAFEEAASWARKALALKPDHALANISLGLALKRLGRRAAALEALRQAVDCAPGLADAHLHLGEELAEEGRRADALAHLEQAVQLAPADDPRPAAALARLRSRAGNERRTPVSQPAGKERP
jgi:tetratricopeptide (TPR) repeat protein